MIMRRAIKFPIHPTPSQETLIQKTFGCTRFIWNQMLSDEQRVYNETGKHFTPTSASYKKQFPFLKEVDSLALANVQMNQNQAFSRFFKNPGKFGHPDFKSKKKSKKSYTTNCLKNKSGKTIFLTKNGIRLPKLGVVKATLYRFPNCQWILKSATISQTKSGRYFCSLLYKFEMPTPDEIFPTEENTVGLDYSSPLFYVDNNGYSPKKLRYFRNSEEKLAKLQHSLSRMKQGSKNYFKLLHKISRLHEHIANQRKDFAHKESGRIANAYGAVCVEDIDLKAIAQSLKLGKSTMDNGFGMFRTFLGYKLAEQGKHLIYIDKWYPSSKTCCFCGSYNKSLKLGEDKWACPHCGKIVPRDKGAALNIKREGLRQFYTEGPAIKSAEKVS